MSQKHYAAATRYYAFTSFGAIEEDMSIRSIDFDSAGSSPAHRRHDADEERTESDAQLIKGLASGEDAGFVAFYEQFATVLFSMTYRILGDRDDAEDSLQEALLQMWQKASTFDASRGGLYTWAAMIARCRAIDRLRRKQSERRKTEAVLNEPLDLHTPLELTPAHNAIRSDEQIRVKAALKLISQPQREALELSFFSAMTQQQISHLLRLPLGTVKARIRRGLIALRRILHRTQASVSYPQRSGPDAKTGRIVLVPC